MDIKDLDNPSAEFQNKIAEYILKSGIPLELIVRDQVRAANAKIPNSVLGDVAHQTIYVDPDDGKVRETDVSWDVSSWHKNDPLILCSYYFECKASEKYSWVFFTEQINSDVNMFSYSANLAYLQILPDLANKPAQVLGVPLFYGHAKKIASSYLTYPENSPDNIRTAVFQAIKPCYVQAQDYLADLLNDKNEYIFTPSLYFPVIVYSGYLFEYEHNPETGVNSLKPTNHVVLKVEHSFNGRRHTYFVDIVRADYLPKYLDQQVTDMMNIHDYMERVKPVGKPIEISRML